MKIDKDPQILPQNITRSASAEPRTGASRKAGQGVEETTDRVELSSARAEVERLKSKVMEIPAIDEEKVARVKQALESGTYKVDGKTLARSILKDQLTEEIN